jgi:uncharacterized protein (TIGR02246 family)
MKAIFTLAAVLMAAPVPAHALTAHQAAVAQTCPSVTTSEIEAQFQRFTDAWATLDPDAVTALFTVEPVLLPTMSNLPRTTAAGVRDYFVSFLRNRPAARIDTSTVEIDCRTASRVGTWTVTLTDPVTGLSREVGARYSFIYRLEAGAWKIDHLHSSLMPEAGVVGVQGH